MTLTETQKTVRVGALAFVAMIIIFYTGKFILNGALTVCRNAELPIPGCKPTEIIPECKYAPLPQLVMRTIKLNDEITYTLDTQDGKLPGFSDRANFYVINNPESNLLAEQQMKEIASDLGFSDTYKNSSASDLRWIDANNSRTLDANVVSKAFVLNTKVDKLASELRAVPSISNEEAKNSALQFIKSQQLIDANEEELLEFEMIPSIMTFGRLKEAIVSVDPPKVTKVNIYRNLDELTLNEDGMVVKVNYPIVGPKPKDALMTFYTTNSSNIAFKYPLIDFNYWRINKEESSQCYLANIENVWNTVSQGNGIIAYIKSEKSDYYDSSIPSDIDEILIRDIYLAYYETEAYQPYLQPIYVFEGVYRSKAKQNSLPDQGEVIIYYPAIDGGYVVTD